MAIQGTESPASPTNNGVATLQPRAVGVSTPPAVPSLPPQAEGSSDPARVDQSSGYSASPSSPPPPPERPLPNTTVVRYLSENPLAPSRPSGLRTTGKALIGTGITITALSAILMITSVAASEQIPKDISPLLDTTAYAGLGGGLGVFGVGLILLAADKKKAQ